MAAKTASETLKTVGDFTNEILDLAEKRGLTLDEVLEVPNILNNRIKNELRETGEPYKREKPTAKATGQ